MKKIPYKELQPNFFCNTPIWLDEKFILLPTNIPIPQSLLQLLRNWGFQDVYTNGNLSIEQYSPKEIISGSYEIKNDYIIDETTQNEIREVYNSLVDFIQVQYKRIAEEGFLEIDIFIQKIKVIIDHIKNNRDYLLRLHDIQSDSVHFFIDFATRVTIIVVAIGVFLKLSQFKLLELGLAGLLSQVGMMRIPSKIYDKPALSETESKIIALHPLQAGKLLNEITKKGKWTLSQDVITAVGQQNARMNGSGIPLGLNGNGILMFGKILAVASAYIRGISKPPYGAGANGHIAILRIIKGVKTLYDENVARALLATLSLYPTGNYVQLNNKSIGLIINNDESNPRSPTIRIQLDEKLRPVNHVPAVKIQPDKDPSIIKVLNRREIAELKSRNLL